MVWLLCDETVPDYPQAEEHLIDRYLAEFADGRSQEEASTYLRVAGVLHMCVRLGGILDEKGKQRWASMEETDKNSPFALRLTPLEEAQRLCRRAARWSKHTVYLEHISQWFLEVSARLPGH